MDMKQNNILPQRKQIFNAKNTQNVLNSKQKDLVLLEKTVKNPQYCQQNQQTLQKLINVNEDYLMNKVKVSDVVKPSAHSHKMPSKTGHSQYNRRYASNTKNIFFNESQSNPKRDTTGSIAKLSNINAPIAGYKSTYNFDFDKKRATLGNDQFNQKCKSAKKYQKEEAPTFNATSYNRDFIVVKCSPQQSAKRKQVKLMGGGKFNSDTTYQHNFYDKLKEIGYKNKPVIHKDHQLFIKLSNQPKSSYQDSFSSNSKPKKQTSCKPIHQYKPSKNKMKYKTEYRDTFIEQKANKKVDFNCLTTDQLKQYVMTILQD